MVDAQKAAVYLRNLIELGIIEREFSVEASIKEQSKGARGLYRMADEFFRFWYAFVFPNRSDLEMLDVDGVYRFDVEPQLTRFASASFEDICRTWLREQNRAGELPTRFGEIGRFWSKQLGIDAVGLSKAHGNRPKGALKLFGECKFGHELVGENVLAHLDDKIAQIAPDGARERYLFALGEGFTEGLEQRAREDGNLHLVSVDELLSLTNRTMQQLETICNNEKGAMSTRPPAARRRGTLGSPRRRHRLPSGRAARVGPPSPACSRISR